MGGAPLGDLSFLSAQVRETGIFPQADALKTLFDPEDFIVSMMRTLRREERVIVITKNGSEEEVQEIFERPLICPSCGKKLSDADFTEYLKSVKTSKKQPPMPACTVCGTRVISVKPLLNEYGLQAILSILRSWVGPAQALTFNEPEKIIRAIGWLKSRLAIQFALYYVDYGLDKKQRGLLLDCLGHVCDTAMRRSILGMSFKGVSRQKSETVVPILPGQQQKPASEVQQHGIQ